MRDAIERLERGIAAEARAQEQNRRDDLESRTHGLRAFARRLDDLVGRLAHRVRSTDLRDRVDDLLDRLEVDALGVGQDAEALHEGVERLDGAEAANRLGDRAHDSRVRQIPRLLDAQDLTEEKAGQGARGAGTSYLAEGPGCGLAAECIGRRKAPNKRRRIGAVLCLVQS